MSNNVPRVGIGVLVFKDNKVLFGKRLKAHGNGYWAPTGGHLECGENFEQCAAREVAEETGIKIHNIRQGPTTNDIFADKHYVTVFMIADYEWRSAMIRTREI